MRLPAWLLGAETCSILMGDLCHRRMRMLPGLPNMVDLVVLMVVVDA